MSDGVTTKKHRNLSSLFRKSTDSSASIPRPKEKPCQAGWFWFLVTLAEANDSIETTY